MQRYKSEFFDKKQIMELKTLIDESTAFHFKMKHEEKKTKSRLKRVSAFANDLEGSLIFGIDNG